MRLETLSPYHSSSPFPISPSLLLRNIHLIAGAIFAGFYNMPMVIVGTAAGYFMGRELLRKVEDAVLRSLFSAHLQTLAFGALVAGITFALHRSTFIPLFYGVYLGLELRSEKSLFF